MFSCEAGFIQYRKKHGQCEAIEFLADINRYTKLYPPKENGRGKVVAPGLHAERTLLDYNEHFIETSNMGENRSLGLMLFGLIGSLPFLPAFFLFADLLRGRSFDFASGALLAMLLSVLALIYFFWPEGIAPHFFTSLCARYRFNRTTGKVYVLRPPKYGGNVVLDWDRVQAHVSWCAPRETEYKDYLRDPQVARHRRLAGGGGHFGMRGLVLYWPPLDSNDPERKGEEVLWVGPKLADEALWQYIRTFMEDGIDAVPLPKDSEWLRKGFSSIGEYVRDNLDDYTLVSLLETVWVPLHCLAERLCTWPTFPKEWGSDCGQKRRESGLGSEEPLRWAVK